VKWTIDDIERYCIEQSASGDLVEGALGMVRLLSQSWDDDGNAIFEYIKRERKRSREGAPKLC
jgi:hypothetical protein